MPSPMPVPVCGPQVWLEESAAPGASVADREEAIRLAGEMLREGRVLAIKGLGGFHLACDATNAPAVRPSAGSERAGRPNPWA